MVSAGGTLGLALSISRTASSPPLLRSTSVTSDISVIVACGGTLTTVANTVANTTVNKVAKSGGKDGGKYGGKSGANKVAKHVTYR